MGYQFDGTNKLIILTTGTLSASAVDVYSRWKDWVLVSDDSKYLNAFTVVGGDPIGPGQSVAPYIFLNTTDGWKIRPQEASHELRIAGNLYSLDPNQSMFTSTLGAYTVTTIVERSSAAIQVAGSGVDQTTVQTALTAQGFTTARAQMIEDVSSGSIVAMGTILSGSSASTFYTTLSASSDHFFDGLAIQLFSAASGSCVRRIESYLQLSGTFNVFGSAPVIPVTGERINVLSSRLALDDPRLNILPVLLG